MKPENPIEDIWRIREELAAEEGCDVPAVLEIRRREEQKHGDRVRPLRETPTGESLTLREIHRRLSEARNELSVRHRQSRLHPLRLERGEGGVRCRGPAVMPQLGTVRVDFEAETLPALSTATPEGELNLAVPPVQSGMPAPP